MYSNSIIDHILQMPGNDKCMECSAPEPKWVSFPSSVFLCFKCARIHKKFSNPQNIKSLELADFTKHEINLLSIGGNNRYTSLMNEYSVSLTEPTPEYKYQTIISTYYCKLLEVEVNKLEKVEGADKEYQELLAKRPIHEIGCELNTDNKYDFDNKSENKPNQIVSESNNNSNNQQSSGWGISSFFGLVNSAIHSSARYIGVEEGLNKMENKINENMEYYGVKSFVKNTSEKVSDMAKSTATMIKDVSISTADYIKDKSTELYQSDLIHNTVDKVSSSMTTIKDKSMTLATDAYNSASNYLGLSDNTGNNTEINNVQQEEPQNIADKLRDDKLK